MDAAHVSFVTSIVALTTSLTTLAALLVKTFREDILPFFKKP
jgi:hypothetical protein